MTHSWLLSPSSAMTTARHVMKPPKTHMTGVASPSFLGISDAILALRLLNMANNTKGEVEIGGRGCRVVGPLRSRLETKC